MSEINILMATYNGEKYISEQIDSIINQTYNNWELLIRDDNSTDKTKNIIKNYAKRDERIRVLEDDLGNVGVAKNFEILLKQSNLDYIMFSDQDDVWMKNKIEILFERIKKCEAKYSDEIPLLVHSDSYITDEHLYVVEDNFIGEKGMNKGLNNIIFSPLVQGSSMMINSNLKRYILPFPKNINIHDHYISIVNEIVGKRLYINKPLMYYRQHSSNEIGVNKNYLNKLKKVLKSDFELTTKKTRKMMDFIYNNFHEKLTNKQKKIIKAFFLITNSNYRFKKAYYILKYKFKTKDGILALIIKVLLKNK
ncbi:rhamnosyltransferase [Halanaerobium saccharolyticum]|uniref:Rhamnosyltransferase n=1 Tax=Halanaerobium saccharolyticum TaxID=43595 RepID=A0A4R7ZAK3_9FIRM|nr:glycosyltransferase family 2 protein [Halanaerobium saccharolyticum]RAK12625.1 rhamnosyltransferase [Halanaerobium saccharolyticum]TDW05463.1 rhamnosyltransferase [Halanaerobium saccharolyticum]TDX62978.1 rhamnosyltransferase [Halanaerobium saccharolyticum]